MIRIRKTSQPTRPIALELCPSSFIIGCVTPGNVMHMAYQWTLHPTKYIHLSFDDQFPLSMTIQLKDLIFNPLPPLQCETSCLTFNVCSIKDECCRRRLSGRWCANYIASQKWIKCCLKWTTQMSLHNLIYVVSCTITISRKFRGLIVRF